MTNDSVSHTHAQQTPLAQLNSYTKWSPAPNLSSIVASMKKKTREMPRNISASISRSSIGWLVLTRVAFALFSLSLSRMIPANFPFYRAHRWAMGYEVWRCWRVHVSERVLNAHVTSNLFNDRSCQCAGSARASAFSDVCASRECVEKCVGNRFMCQFELLSK